MKTFINRISVGQSCRSAKLPLPAAGQRRPATPSVTSVPSCLKKPGFSNQHLAFIRAFVPSCESDPFFSAKRTQFQNAFKPYEHQPLNPYFLNWLCSKTNPIFTPVGHDVTGADHRQSLSVMVRCSRLVHRAEKYLSLLTSAPTSESIRVNWRREVALPLRG
jgi:hypothetical protein